MSGLSNEDRADLEMAARSTNLWVSDLQVDAIAATTEAIVAHHVAAALIEATDMSGWVSVEADKHRPDQKRGGCTCGFCAWSPEHVALMAHRDGMYAHIANRRRAAIPTDSATPSAPTD